MHHTNIDPTKHNETNAHTKNIITACILGALALLSLIMGAYSMSQSF